MNNEEFEKAFEGLSKKQVQYIKQNGEEVYFAIYKTVVKENSQQILKSRLDFCFIGLTDTSFADRESFLEIWKENIPQNAFNIEIEVRNYDDFIEIFLNFSYFGVPRDLQQCAYTRFTNKIGAEKRQKTKRETMTKNKYL
jgi:hypothetical protein